MTERAITGPFRWVVVNGDGHEYLVGQGQFGDEFVKLEDGTCARRPIEGGNGESARSEGGERC